MHASKFIDAEKTVPEGAGIDLDGMPVRRCRGMIYWYRWGRHTFDIREIRKLLGLQEDHGADKYFMPDSAYFRKDQQALADIVGQIRNALGTKPFKPLIKQHDAVLEKSHG